MTMHAKNILARIESYFSKYVAAPAEYHFVAALWAAMTYVYRELDTVPYLCVGALTKRSGKTLFAIDLLRPICNQALNATGMSGPVLYRMLHKNDGGVLFSDEAERLASEAAGKLREAMNIGYKRGQTYPVVVGGDIVHMPVFGPKCFVLIGDVNDTLRDRSIIFMMRRATPDQEMKLARFVSTNVEAEATEIAVDLKQIMADNRAAIVDAYRSHEGLEWLRSRDAEIWLSLFAICQLLAPDRVAELTRISTDLCADKTGDTVKYNADAAASAEKRAERAEYCVRLIRDLVTVIGENKNLFSADVVTALKALPTAPWRRYKGRGLTDQDIGFLLPPRLRAKNIRTNAKRDGKGQQVRRGWVKADLDAALKDMGGLLSELSDDSV